MVLTVNFISKLVIKLVIQLYSQSRTWSFPSLVISVRQEYAFVYIFVIYPQSRVSHEVFSLLHWALVLRHAPEIVVFPLALIRVDSVFGARLDCAGRPFGQEGFLAWAVVHHLLILGSHQLFPELLVFFLEGVLLVHMVVDLAILGLDDGDETLYLFLEFLVFGVDVDNHLLKGWVIWDCYSSARRSWCLPWSRCPNFPWLRSVFRQFCWPLRSCCGEAACRTTIGAGTMAPCSWRFPASCSSCRWSP